MVSNCVHHVEFGVTNGLKFVKTFLSQYKFRLAGIRATESANQWLVYSHAVRFLITELKKDISSIKKDPYIHPWSFSSEEISRPSRDSVFNVALRVKNIDGCINRLVKQKVEIVKPIQTLSDHAGSVQVCTVKSCVGNVVHTLVDDTNYSGLFLPQFEVAESLSDVLIDESSKNERYAESEAEHVNLVQSPSNSDLHHVDHVTMCVPCGSSASVISWYERCFGMKRFFVNRDESEEEGYVINGDDIGMRLTAMEYWKCAETGLATQDTSTFQGIKFVIAEALPNQGMNQVDVFLANHGGAGIQHIGLHTDDIINAVQCLESRGVQFNQIPYTYYTEVGRLKEMVAMGMDVKKLQTNGILVDTEVEDDCGDRNQGDVSTPSTSLRYLMQKFTRPIFEADTFFLEVIQRVGAAGFGSGNIIALWRSVQAYMREKGLETAPVKAKEEK